MEKADSHPESKVGKTKTTENGALIGHSEEEVIKTSLEEVAIVTVDTKTGDVLVIVRGRDSIHDHTKTNVDHCLRRKSLAERPPRRTPAAAPP